MEVVSEVAGYAEGPVTVPGGTGAGVARLSIKDRRRLARRRLACRARARSAGDGVGSGAGSGVGCGAGDRVGNGAGFLEPHMARNVFLSGEPVGVEEAVSETEAEGSEVMTASTGSWTGS